MRKYTWETIQKSLAGNILSSFPTRLYTRATFQVYAPREASARRYIFENDCGYVIKSVNWSPALKSYIYVGCDSAYNLPYIYDYPKRLLIRYNRYYAPRISFESSWIIASTAYDLCIHLVVVAISAGLKTFTFFYWKYMRAAKV